MRSPAPALSWFESNPGPAGAGRPRWLQPALIALLLLLQLPFLSVAFRVDEPNIIALARQIEKNPLDPYGFEINWTGVTKPAFEILANPPLYPSWLALWARGFGWSEIALHASNVPFAVGALMAFMALARRIDLPSVLAGFLVLSSPAFLLATHVVMPDLAMLTCFLLAIAGAFSFHQMGGRGWLVIAFIAAFVAPLMKYNAILLSPLLLVFWFLADRRRSLFFLAMTPAIAFGAWMALSWRMYGLPHFLAVGGLEGGPRSHVVSGVMSVLGLGVIPLALAFTRVRNPSPMNRWPLSAAVFVAASLLGFFILGYPIRPAIVFGASVAISVHFLILLLLEIEPAVKRRDGISLLLIAWILLVLVFQFKLIFTSVRYLLPVLPAVVLLLLRMGSENRPSSSRFRALCAASLMLTLCVAIGDAAIANVYRRFVAESASMRRAGNERIYFSGHWGFQHYAEKAGAIQVESWPEPRYEIGDRVVVARNPFPSVLKPEAQRIHWKRTDVDQKLFWPVRTIDCESAANFYGNGIGPCRFQGTASIPFGFNNGPAERFSIFDAVSTVPSRGISSP